eukprot:TRINITY_DN2368_c0_g1_i1.p1 TRINITY_DN2368_c0_g1~~TRINITY_DN2368_c0_g1_i1.p1  ORF type:complete len:387 (+),score=94.42 TRINITY_DN2368_c0_g1_i1:91-1251(+)
MNHYAKIEKLGEGGQGKVYKVKRRADGKVLVLKMINCTDATYMKHAQTEVAVMRGLQHPHLAALVDHFVYQGTSHKYVCIVMPYYECGDLFAKFCQVRKANGKFPEQQLIKYTSQICSGLQYLHERDSWHRDVKASNILLDERGDLKLADFGLSAMYSQAGHKTVVGTPYYFAPEVMMHERYTSKVDIWNVGVLLLELVTLQQQPINVEVLCENNDIKKKIMGLVTDRGYSRQLGLLISSMLSKNPSSRPSARETLQLLLPPDSTLLLGDSSPEAHTLLRTQLTNLNICSSPTRAKPKQRSADTSGTATTGSGSSASPPLTSGSAGSTGNTTEVREKQCKTTDSKEGGNSIQKKKVYVKNGLRKEEVELLQDKLRKLANMADGATR